MEKKGIVVLGVLIAAFLWWWFYSPDPLPLGYRGTAEHLRNVPGTRPTVALPTANNYIKRIQLTVDGHDLRTVTSELTLPRDRNVPVKGILDLDLGKTGEFSGAYIGVGSESSNAQGVLIESELMISDRSYQHTQGQPLVFNINQTWRTPDRSGEFVLIVYYFAGEIGEMRTPGRKAFVLPIRIE